MKVILVRDVARLGRKSEVKDVPSGHAQNFLIPRKLAIPATPENMRRLGEVAKRTAEAEASRSESFSASLAKLTGPVRYAAEANDQGSLFKGLHARDIASILQGMGCDIEERDIVLQEPIKSVGMHEIGLERGATKGACTLEVVKK